MDTCPLVTYSKSTFSQSFERIESQRYLWREIFELVGKSIEAYSKLSNTCYCNVLMMWWDREMVDRDVSSNSPTHTIKVARQRVHFSLIYWLLYSEKFLHMRWGVHATPLSHSSFHGLVAWLIITRKTFVWFYKVRDLLNYNICMIL